ncbi:hypothetical protein D3C72_2047760 [compost metagenome]
MIGVSGPSPGWYVAGGLKVKVARLVLPLHVLVWGVRLQRVPPGWVTLAAPPVNSAR